MWPWTVSPGTRTAHALRTAVLRRRDPISVQIIRRLPGVARTVVGRYHNRGLAGGRYEYYHFPRPAQPTICPGPADPAELSGRPHCLADRRTRSVRTSDRKSVV